MPAVFFTLTKQTAAISIKELNGQMNKFIQYSLSLSLVELRRRRQCLGDKKSSASIKASFRRKKMKNLNSSTCSELSFHSVVLQFSSKSWPMMSACFKTTLFASRININISLHFSDNSIYYIYIGGKRKDERSEWWLFRGSSSWWQRTEKKEQTKFFKYPNKNSLRKLSCVAVLDKYFCRTNVAAVNTRRVQQRTNLQNLHIKVAFHRAEIYELLSDIVRRNNIQIKHS